ncbi:hypothetical protein N7488_001459 [Penicillium malachiteum]|nr:hypothetical protein N7488_001459 [Penicillium malachiteum]
MSDYYNGINVDDCTLATCPISLAHVTYQPNLAANILFVLIFSVIMAAQAYLGTRFRIWTYMGAMIPGLILEVLGYAGRIMMHHNPFNFSGFLLYLIPLTIGPAFFTAAIYICLGKIIIVYGEDISRLRPKTYSYIFITCDLIALVLQAAGGAVSSIATSSQQSLSNAGVNTMIAGLAFQVGSLTLFVALALDFTLRVRRSAEIMKNEATETLRASGKWKMFLGGLGVAVLTIYIRSCFRVAELQGGFSSSLANNEVALMILESLMVTIACTAMTVAHPGRIMGDQWRLLAPKAAGHYSNATLAKEPMISSGEELQSV